MDQIVVETVSEYLKSTEGLFASLISSQTDIRNAISKLYEHQEAALEIIKRQGEIIERLARQARG